MKSIKALLSGLFVMVLAITSYSQTYSRVSIQINNAEEMKKFRSLPIAADHGIWIKNRFETDLNTGEIQKVKNAGITCDVLIADVAAYYANRNNNKNKSPQGGNTIQGGTGCGPATDVPELIKLQLRVYGGLFYL
ncbi:MAG: hypothetical protein M0D57_20040 [Sphingobacteriales bacterium JAD_PAG50586_3]|nr:MAG: hypothetical protein M0D57_20040 [Sphingobacteriales bacterium JAD_PAG50586_3]